MRRFAAPVAVAVLVAALLTATTVLTAAPAAAAEPPLLGAVHGSVSADVLPTAQIDGVAYTQVVVGGTVFVGGRFSEARPAGVAPGGPGEVARDNVLAYDLRTGDLLPFAPDLDGQVKDLAVSPDGRTLYVAGQFTHVDDVARYRIAAFDIGSGALVAGFAPAIDYVVDAVVPIGGTVYVGGEFGFVGSVVRSRLAALRATDGALLAWNPGADAAVLTMVRAPGGSIVVGGSFATLTGATGTGGAQSAIGMGAFDPRTGAVRPWPAATVVRNSGSGSAITHLTTDGRQVYGTGYNYQGTGNLEGAFATDGQGRLVWVEDCHGDSYGVWSSGRVVFVVGHPHSCATIGGFPETDPITYRHALAFTSDVRGTLATNTDARYRDWGGTPAPALTTWFPDFAMGTVTGLNQSTWTVTGDGTYLAVGGEFPRVGGVAQQGLARFLVRPDAPNRVGPQQQGAAFPVTASVAAGGAVTLAFTADTDPDDLTLTYTVRRDGTAVGRLRAHSTFWDRPALGFTDPRAPAGTTSTYTVVATDPAGNQAVSAPVRVTVP